MSALYSLITKKTRFSRSSIDCSIKELKSLIHIEQIEMDRPDMPLKNATFTTQVDSPTIIGSSDSDRPNGRRVKIGESKRGGSDGRNSFPLSFLYKQTWINIGFN